jgi:ATP-dependent protease HslVU (ClpYQ) peptidase subunit
VADSSVSFEITGLGDVLEPKDGVIAIGSGGTFALGACVLYPYTSNSVEHMGLRI